MRRDPMDQQIINDLNSDDPMTVLRAIRRTLLVLRSEVRIARTSWRFTAAVVVIALALGSWLIYRTNTTATTTQHAVDEIVVARLSSQQGLCAAINDMRAKHNHFVNTTIAERQQIIDTAADEQTRSFFEAQITNYRSDLLPIIDCNNRDALAALFTKPGG